MVGPTLGLFLGLGNIRYSVEGALPEPGVKMFVTAPQAAIEIKASDALRIGIGASYRFIVGPDLSEQLADDVKGLVGMGFFRVHP